MWTRVLLLVLVLVSAPAASFAATVCCETAEQCCEDVTSTCPELPSGECAVVLAGILKKTVPADSPQMSVAHLLRLPDFLASPSRQAAVAAVFARAGEPSLLLSTPLRI